MSVTLFHHTTLEGLKGIMSDGRIKESGLDGEDAIYGPGVYLTSLGPDRSIKTVAVNNFDRAASAMIKEGRCDVILEVNVSKKYVRKVDSDRDIFIHSGDILTSKIVSIHKRNEKGEAIEYKIKTEKSK